MVVTTGKVGSWHLVGRAARDAAKHRTVHKMAPYNRELSGSKYQYIVLRLRNPVLHYCCFLNFEVIVDLQMNFKDRTESSFISFTQLLLKLTSYIIMEHLSKLRN